MALVAVDGIVLAAGMLLFLAAILGVSAALADGFDGLMLSLILGVPGFGYHHDGHSESGNALFGVYVQLRWASLAVLGAVAAVSAARHRRRAAGILLRAALAGMLLFAFPPAWDYLAWTAGAAGMWVLNPHYTLDPDRPCPADWDADRLRMVHGSSPYGAGPDAGGVCSPGLRVSYLVGQAAGITDAGAAEPGHPGVLGMVAESIPAGLEGAFVNVFAAVAKALTMINLAVAAAAAGVVLDLFTGLVIGSLPVMVVLGMIPGTAGISARFLGAVPALLLAPPAAAAVVVAGSSAVAAADSGTLAAWAGAVSVLFLASLLPAAMVPTVSAVVHAATGTLSSAVGSAATITGLGLLGTGSGASARGQHRAAHGGLEGLAGERAGSPGGTGRG